MTDSKNNVSQQNKESSESSESKSEQHVDKFSILGFILYVVIFILLIPYLLLQYKRHDILAAYFPNLDNLATALGYMGGPPVQYPGKLWKYLRDSCEENWFQFISVSFIHYISLLGLTFIVAHYTNKYKSVSNGWAIAFFMLFVTYIIPGHLIQHSQELFGDKISSVLPYKTFSHYLSVASFGLFIVYMLIFIEEKLIHEYSDDLAKLIRYIANIFYIKLN